MKKPSVVEAKIIVTPLAWRRKDWRVGLEDEIRGLRAQLVRLILQWRKKAGLKP